MEKRCELIASSEVLSPLRRELRELFGQAGWDKKTVEEVLLAVDEALTNVIRHAYKGNPGKMTVDVAVSSDKIEIVLEDHGEKFDPTQVPPPELPRQKPGGLGVHFIRTIMDQVIYEGHQVDGNRLRMIKHKAKNLKREGGL